MSWVLLALLSQAPSWVCGRVTDERLEPRAGAVVTALRGTSPDPVNGTVAGPDGRYCIRYLTPGEYKLRASARVNPPTGAPDCVDCCGRAFEFPTTYYGGALSQERAAAVMLKPGDQAAYDIVMRRAPAYCVRGEVRNERGELLGDVGIGIEQDGSWGTGVVNGGGRFLLTNLPSGSYTLKVYEAGASKLDARVIVRRVIEVRGANISRLVITVPGLR